MLGNAAMNRQRTHLSYAFRLWAALLGCWLVQGQALRTPDGFAIERAAPEGLLSYPMFACFDEDGHLYVAESSGLDLYEELQKQTRRCRVKRLTDKDGDGVYETATVFADKLVFPMGLAWRDGRLYVADPPDLITLEDANGDGEGENRKVILSGFGHMDNGSLHGLIFGPDGWLYLTMGQPDGYHLPRGDGTFVKSEVGALLRCRPDGSQVEVLASGFENLVEVVFLPEGEIVGTLNWFSLPEEGLRDALVMLAPGGRYPLKGRAPVLPEFFEGELLPALAHYPAVALSGLELYRGRAFPEMSGHLFSAQFNARKIVRHELSRRGASFQTTDHDFVTTNDPDVHFSDVLEDADGSLLAVDTGSWYVHHCPTGRIRNSPAPGGLWRVRHRAAERPADPRGRRLEWARATTPGLTERLRSPWPAIRERAGKLLEGRADAISGLGQWLEEGEPEAARITAAWALGTHSAPLREVLRRQNDPLAPLAARILGERRDSSAGADLMAALASPRGALRMGAAEALARTGSTAAGAALVERLAVEEDPWVIHALHRALHACSDTTELRALLKHASPEGQRAALILLDQSNRRALRAEDVLERIDTGHAGLHATAIRLLEAHPEWSGAARERWRRLQEKEVVDHREARLFEVLSRICHRDAAATADLAAALRSPAPSWRQQRALQAMRAASVTPLPPGWHELIDVALRSEHADVRRDAVNFAARQPERGWKPVLEAIMAGTRDGLACRLPALRVLLRSDSSLDDQKTALLLEALRAADPPGIQLEAAELVARSRPNSAQLLALAGSESPFLGAAHLIGAARNAGLRGGELAPVAEQMIERLRAGEPAAAEQVAWLAENSPPALGGRIRAAQEARVHAQSTRLETYLPLLGRSVSDRGRNVFEKAGCANCHRVDSPGERAGPDLSRIGGIRSGRDLLESIVWPSASFAQGYETLRAKLADGEALTGVRVKTEGGPLRLRDASGREIHLPPETPLEPSPISLMPEGLLNGLSEDEVADLLAYLQSLK